jgi:hypothetical protein
VPGGCRRTDGDDSSLTDIASFNIGYSSIVSPDASDEVDSVNSKSPIPTSKSLTSSSFLTVTGDVFSDRIKAFKWTIQRMRKIKPTTDAMILHLSFVSGLRSVAISDAPPTKPDENPTR